MSNCFFNQLDSFCQARRVENYNSLDMRPLMMGRPPRRHWRIPRDTHVTVLSNRPAAEDWYKTIVVTDLTDIELALTALHRSGEVSFDVAYCDYEPAMISTAVLARALGCAIAVDDRLAVLGRDKYLQKRRIAAAGIPVTDFELVPAEPRQRLRYRPDFGYPAILKPTLGFGGRDVRQAHSEQELRAAISAISDSVPYMCERFITGSELHIDAIIYRSEIAFLSVGSYLTNVIDMNVPKPTGSVILPGIGYERLYDACEHLLRRVLKAIGHSRGVVHMEAFDTSNGLVFSEIALRRGGSKIAEAIELASGADLRELSFLASIGCLPDLPVSRPSELIGWFLVPAGPGRLKTLPEPGDFTGVQGVRAIDFDRDLIGEVLGKPGSRLDAIGYCAISGTSLAAVLETIGVMFGRAMGRIEYSSV